MGVRALLAQAHPQSPAYAAHHRPRSSNSNSSSSHRLPACAAVPAACLPSRRPAIRHRSLLHSPGQASRDQSQALHRLKPLHHPTPRPWPSRIPQTVKPHSHMEPSQGQGQYPSPATGLACRHLRIRLVPTPLMVASCQQHLQPPESSLVSSNEFSVPLGIPGGHQARYRPYIQGAQPHLLHQDVCSCSFTKTAEMITHGPDHNACSFLLGVRSSSYWKI